MKVLLYFCESVVLIWSICLILSTSGDFRSKPEKPISGSKVVFSCDISADTENIKWTKNDTVMFSCSAPFSAGFCEIHPEENSNYDFNVKQSRSGLVSSITIKKFDNGNDKKWECEHDDQPIGYPTDERGKETMNITFSPEKTTYEKSNIIEVRCGNDEQQSFYEIIRGNRGNLYSNENVTLKCFHTGVECVNDTITQFKEINVNCIEVVSSPGVHDVTAAVGDDTELVVDIIMYPVNESRVHWYKIGEGKRNKLSNYRTHRFVNKTKAILTIYEVQAIDSGIYEVNIKLSDDENQMVEFKLKVEDNSEIGFGAGIGVGICLGFLCGSAIIVGGWFIWRWKKSKGRTYQQEEYENVEYKNKC